MELKASFSVVQQFLRRGFGSYHCHLRLKNYCRNRSKTSPDALSSGVDKPKSGKNPPLTWDFRLISSETVNAVKKHSPLPRSVKRDFMARM